MTHQNKGLHKAIGLQKKKNKKGVRLNLCGQENKDIIDCYSPTTVVKARKYAEQKEVENEVEEKHKYDNRVKRAANALKKAKEKEEKEARAATRQLTADLKTAAEAVQKALESQQKSVATKAKKAAPIVSKTQKAPVKARLPPKSPVKHVVEAPIEKVVTLEVVTMTRSKRAVKLPQRYVQKN